MKQQMADKNLDFAVHSFRSPWRQRIVDAERGIVSCFRGNSALFVYFFAICTLLSTAVVVELSPFVWALNLFCVVCIISGELVYDSLRKIVQKNREQFSPETLELLNRINAAFMLLIIGSFFTILCSLGSRMVQLEWF